MGMSFRINKMEQEAIRKKAVELNRKLVEAGRSPLRDSELVHKILIKAIKNSELNENFDVVIKKD